jgi:hypothetical protein
VPQGCGADAAQAIHHGCVSPQHIRAIGVRCQSPHQHRALSWHDCPQHPAPQLQVGDATLEHSPPRLYTCVITHETLALPRSLVDAACSGAVCHPWRTDRRPRRAGQVPRRTQISRLLSRQPWRELQVLSAPDRFLWPRAALLRVCVPPVSR